MRAGVPAVANRHHAIDDHRVDADGILVGPQGRPSLTLTVKQLNENFRIPTVSRLKRISCETPVVECGVRPLAFTNDKRRDVRGPDARTSENEINPTVTPLRLDRKLRRLDPKVLLAACADGEFGNPSKHGLLKRSKTRARWGYGRRPIA